MIRNFLRAIAASLLIAQSSVAAVTFSISFPESVRSAPATGRLVLYLIRPDASVGKMHPPASGFVEEDPQPIYGIDVTDLAPGKLATIDDTATAFPVKLSALPAGKYRAQAVLDMHHQNSGWQRETGNLFSTPIGFEISAGKSPIVKLELTQVAKEREPTKTKGVEIVRLRSKLLSDFRGEDVYLRAGVVFPMEYDSNRAYPAVYEIPGFGGDHLSAYFKAMRRGQRERGTAADQIAHNTFWIELDPESPNGHTLFADSDVNGPCAQALIRELIPEIEKKFNLIAQPSAHIVTGHSSGGWASLWLGTEYADFFGATWSSSPDPVDFRRLEIADIYTVKNLYLDDTGKDVPDARFDGKATMTTRQENSMEQVLGEHNDSAQQWDSWQAVWGHKDVNGRTKPLFDAITGAMDHDEAESYRRFDIADRLRKNPGRFAAIFRSQIHVVCGTEDTYYLNEAVQLLKHDLDEVDSKGGGDGYIKLAPGDHQSVTQSKEYQAWASEMMAYLRQHKHAPSASQPSK